MLTTFLFNDSLHCKQVPTPGLAFPKLLFHIRQQKRWVWATSRAYPRLELLITWKFRRNVDGFPSAVFKSVLGLTSDYGALIPWSFFSVSQNFWSSVKYLSRINTLERPSVAMITTQALSQGNRKRHRALCAALTIRPIASSRRIPSVRLKLRWEGRYRQARWRCSLTCPPPPSPLQPTVRAGGGGRGDWGRAAGKQWRRCPKRFGCGFRTGTCPAQVSLRWRRKNATRRNRGGGGRGPGHPSTDSTFLLTYLPNWLIVFIG